MSDIYFLYYLQYIHLFYQKYIYWGFTPIYAFINDVVNMNTFTWIFIKIINIDFVTKIIISTTFDISFF